MNIHFGSDVGDSSVRKFHVPPLNYDAQDFTSIINWNHNATEPIFTCNFTLSDLINIAQAPMRVENYPVHTQSVERRQNSDRSC